MKIETKRAYQEVYVILEQMPKEYVDKLPDKMKELIEYSRDKSYKPKIDLNKDLSKQGLSDKAVNILAVLYYKYWTLTDVEKKELYDFLMAETKKNEHKFRVQQGDRLNTEDVFKEEKKPEINSYIPKEKIKYEPHPNYYPVVQEKKGFFRRLLDKLKEIFS